MATFAALAEFNCIMKFSPQTAVVSSVDQVQDAVNGAFGCVISLVDVIVGKEDLEMCMEGAQRGHCSSVLRIHCLK